MSQNLAFAAAVIGAYRVTKSPGPTELASTARPPED